VVHLKTAKALGLTVPQSQIWWAAELEGLSAKSEADLLMRSKVRAYSHQGHGPRAEQQAGCISATSDSTTSLAKGSRSIHRGNSCRSIALTRVTVHMGMFEVKGQVRGS
jgi:hypothetical protein